MSVCPWHQMLLATGVKPSVFFFFFQFPLISATDTQEGVNVALTPFLDADLSSLQRIPPRTHS